jgi:signal transduction histidine kinase/CheY-like chemotaxis protein
VGLIGGCAGSIWLWDPAAEHLAPAASVGLDGARLAPVRLRLGEGIGGMVAQARAGCIVPDRARSPHQAAQLRPLALPGAVLTEPLCYQDRLVGTIAVDRRTADPPFTPADQELLRLFTTQAAVAIENARRYAAAERRARELAGILTATRAVQAGLDRDETLRQIVAQAEAISGAAVRLFLLDEARQTLRCEVWSAGAPPPDNITLRVGESFSGHVAATRQPLAVPDVRQDPRVHLPDRVARFGLISYLGLPVLSGERLDGVLVFSTPTPHTYPPEEVAALEHFAAHAAIALENARLYAAAQQALAAQQRAQAELVRTEQLRGLGQMAAGIAHDLNNTLATVLGQVEIATHAALPLDAQEALAAIETAASDGAATVRRLQNFARPKGSSPLVPCALDAIVRETIELTRPRWQAESQRRGVTIAVHCDLPADLPSVLGYPPELREVLTNLIFNAVDAMPHGGRLTIGARVAPPVAGRQSGRPAGGQVELTVSDTGIGMTAEVQAKVFEPFFTTKGVRGTGLGLAVVYGILERHGGAITVTSAVGQGTTLILTLQRAGTPVVPASPAPRAPSRPPARRLLVVDDEAGVRRTLARLLKLAGHQPVEASDGPHALEILAETPVDCVITDLGMPEMNGWELARCVRRAHPGLPILLLTGWQDQAPQAPGDQAAVDAVLGKPVQVGTLLAAIEAATGRGPR